MLAATLVAGATLAAVAAQQGRAAADSWVPGTGQATATAIALHPTTGGLGYTVKLATSIADYADQEAQAQSQTFDGGAIVLAATSTQCDGSAPVVAQSQLPPVAQAESNSGNQSQDLALNGLHSGGNGAGDEHAAATTKPEGTAVTHLADFNVPGVITISGGDSSADAQMVTGQTRTATATADVGQVSLLNGLVTLNGLHWTTTQQTGPSNQVLAQTGSFSLTSVTVSGITTPVNVDNLNTVLTIVNTALAPTGFHVGPVPTLQVNPANRSTSVPPLAIGMDNSALGTQIVGTVLSQSPVETVREAIVNAILNQSCKYGTEITVGDILLGVLSGGGNLDLEFGGVTAVTDGTYIANPFANSLGLLGADSVVDTTEAVSSADATPGTYTAGTPGSPGTVGTSGADTGARALPLSRTLHCLTTSPFGHPGCSGGGAALPIGLVGLGVVMGMGAVDFARARRLRRVLPEEEDL
ncbi:MAG TPA: choice-of-anchor P family protein [Acidimicrobiales bacterium]|nr:choice-of-anchor P family protein [Acidimicrobiales bacterium]